MLPSGEDRERFNAICKKENKTQSETLLMLMELYDKQPSSVDKVEKITLPLFVYSGNRKTQRRTLSFQGRLEFRSGWTDLYQLGRIVAEKLKKDFACPVGDGEIYLYSHHMNLYYDVKKRSYLVHEGIWVQLKEDYANLLEGGAFESPLMVSRCKYVDTFEDVNTHFSRYATTFEINGISQFLSDEIGDDYGAMDKFFGDIEFLD